MNSRRKFLQQITAASVLLPYLPKQCLANEKEAKTNDNGQTLRVAIMGLGGYATRVAEAMKACQQS